MYAQPQDNPVVLNTPPSPTTRFTREDDVLNDVLDVRGAAKLLKTSAENVMKLSRQAKIPAQALGARWRYSRAALLQWLSQPGRQGPIKPTRKLADYPPSKLLARIRKLGGALALVNGRLVLQRLSKDQLTPKLWAALEKNHAKLVQELQREQQHQE